MKIEPRLAEAFLKKPDPKIRGVVVYGNDDGLIAERAARLAKSACIRPAGVMVTWLSCKQRNGVRFLGRAFEFVVPPLGGAATAD